MEFYLERRLIQQLRIAAQEAIEEGENDSLREEIHDTFSEEQVDEIERRVDGGDFHEFVNEILEEWSGDDVEELLELIEAQLAEVGIDMKQANADFDGESEEEDSETAGDGGDELDLETTEIDSGDEELL